MKIQKIILQKVLPFLMTAVLLAGCGSPSTTPKDGFWSSEEEVPSGGYMTLFVKEGKVRSIRFDLNIAVPSVGCGWQNLDNPLAVRPDGTFSNEHEKQATKVNGQFYSSKKGHIIFETTSCSQVPFGGGLPITYRGDVKVEMDIKFDHK